MQKICDPLRWHARKDVQLVVRLAATAIPDPAHSLPLIEEKRIMHSEQFIIRYVMLVVSCDFTQY